jgi:hypothetical protein
VTSVFLPVTLPVELPALPDIDDHRIGGKVTVPAVELLEILAQAITQHTGQLPLPLVMTDAVFPHFLPKSEIERCKFDLTLNQVQEDPAAGIRVTLASRIGLAGGMRRARVHAAVTFGARLAPPSRPPDGLDCEIEVPAARLYQDLIPLGPRFRNLRGTLRLGRAGATGTVRSPEPLRSHAPLMGCPYLLDAAMHLACLWGQRYASMVAYPTGFATRSLTSPVAHGERRCTVVPRIVEPRRLLCDLWLANEQGEICDRVTGLAMVPLASGATPPAWIALAKDAP